MIFPVAGATKLKAIIDEHRAKGTLDARIQMVMRGSRASHYRRMLPSLLSVLRFRSKNESWRPILNALSLTTFSPWLLRVPGFCLISTPW
ncbi:hypothetical protein RA27_22550 [Ruegeria sp. ANG-R]|nr:hypothetical protein RA27_22550 [Ruegeria sp. ANG-R]